LGKPTEQSSVYHIGAYGLFPSSLAVDGNRGDAYKSDQNKPQCSMTHKDLKAWWRVDFGETIPVSRVAITNRGDCCWGSLKDVELRVR
jgi:hypothetical protein